MTYAGKEATPAKQWSLYVSEFIATHCSGRAVKGLTILVISREAVVCLGLCVFTCLLKSALICSSRGSVSLQDSVVD